MAEQPSRFTTLWRGFTKRCARCGKGRLFRRWFVMVPDCPRCGLHFEREQGYWTGALAFNMIMVGGLFAVAFVVTLIFSLPDVEPVDLLVVCLPIVALGPIILYPFSKTVWVAVDRAFLQRLDVNERPDEQARKY